MSISGNWLNKAITKAINFLGKLLPKPNFESIVWAPAEFEVLVYDNATGQLVDRMCSAGSNIVVDDGRIQVLKHVLNITSPGAPVTFPYLGVGSGVTAESAANTALQTELTGNANRKTLTNVSALPFTDSDIVFEVSGSFRWKVIAQATFADVDGNNGSVFSEYGLFSTNVFATGKMYNRFVSPSPFTKSGSLSVVVNVTLRA